MASFGGFGELWWHSEAHVLGDSRQYCELDSAMSRSRSISASTSSAGADAPAVMPTAVTPLTQRGSSAAASSIR